MLPEMVGEFTGGSMGESILEVFSDYV